MTDVNWDKLKKLATETIEDIDTDNLTKDKFILYGASIAILAHEEPHNVNIPMTYETPMQTQPYKPVALPANISLRKLVGDELSDAEKYYAMGEYDIARDEIRHAKRFLSVLQAKSNEHDLHDLTERLNTLEMKI